MESTKTCKKCLKELPYADFNSQPRTRDQLFSWCKSCHRKSSQEYYEKNKNKRKKQIKKWQAENSEKVKENQKNYMLKLKGGIQKTNEVTPTANSETLQNGQPS